MKLCQKCENELAKIVILPATMMYEPYASESDCEFWAHKAWNDWMEENFKEPTKA